MKLGSRPLQPPRTSKTQPPKHTIDGAHATRQDAKGLGAVRQPAYSPRDLAHRAQEAWQEARGKSDRFLRKHPELTEFPSYQKTLRRDSSDKPRRHKPSARRGKPR